MSNSPKTPFGLFSYQFRTSLRDPIPATLKFGTSKPESVKNTNVPFITPAAHSTVGLRVAWVVIPSSE